MTADSDRVKRAGRPPPLAAAAARLSDGTYLAAIGLAPLPFGSIEPFWIDVLLLLIAASLVTARGWSADARIGWIVVAVAGVVATIVAVAVFQAMPGAPAWVADPVWRTLPEGLGVDAPPRAAANGTGPWHALGPSLLFGCVFLRSLIFASSTERARRVLRVLACVGLAVAVYGIAAAQIAPDHLLWLEKTAYRGSVTGTFVNRNTAAAYFGATSLIWLVLGLEAMRRRSSLGRLALPAAGILVGLIACMLTGSRAGAVLSVAIGAAIAAFGLRGSGRRIERRELGWGGAVCALALVALLSVSAVGQRIEGAGLTDASRLEVYRSAFAMIADRPLLGHGLGSFELQFPAYRTAALGSRGVFDAAHSTPLEIAVELGLPTLLLVAILWAWVAAALVRTSLEPGRRGLIALGGLAVGLLGTLHSLIDFPLQIPGFALLVAATAGSGLAGLRTSDGAGAPERSVRVVR